MTTHAALQTHDRRAVQVPDSAIARVIIVDDPYQPGDKITVIASMRDDPLARLHERRQIDDAQFAAGREYQRLCEIAEISGVKAMDPTKEPVDGAGAAHEPYSDAKRAASLMLNRLARELGKEGESICRAVLAQGMFLGALAESRGIRLSDRVARYFGMRFRECLETLAVALNYAPPKRNAS